MKPIRVTDYEFDTFAELKEDWNRFLKSANENHSKFQDPQFREELIGYVHMKADYWRHMTFKYKLDPFRRYRVNDYGYLEEERGRDLWRLLERQ